MPFREGPIVADASVSALAWAGCSERSPLVLVPGSTRGWFGGTSLAAFDPRLERIEIRGPARPYDMTPALQGAGELIDSVLSSSTPRLCAALLDYEGSAMIGIFDRGVMRCEDGWRAWGDWDGVRLPAVGATPEASTMPSERLHSTMSAEQFMDAVEHLRECMSQGDLYLANLCRTLSGQCATDAGSVFSALIRRSRADFGAAWRLAAGRTVLSASPERFLRLENGLLVTEPIKGTRPRGRDEAEDARIVTELRSSEKEQAEHLMTVDLERNDIGRVCEPGSVTVGGLMRIETTPYCHQMVSSVGGILRRDAGWADVLAATFPCGSVVGAPKIAASEHVRRLEHGPRGLYTGSLVVSMPGRVDSSVLIRTAVLEHGHLTYGVGGGITVDSDARAEWEETVVKSAPLTGSVS